MSYDITIAAYAKPTDEAIAAWARGKGLEILAAPDGQSFTVQRPGRADGDHVCEVSGPDPAEPEDFDEELAEACLAPKWMLQVSAPYTAPKAKLALARSLARHLAEHGQGAAFDPQEDRLLWPRGKRARTPSRTGEQETEMLTLTWFVAPSRWAAAAGNIVPLIVRRCPEALPRRYGAWEPPPHRFDRTDTAAFADFVASSEDGSGFWYASRPSFGGSFLAPYADKRARGDDERFRIGRVEVSFDCHLVGADERWREAVVDLFVRGSEGFEAFFAAAQVVPGWVVSRNNRAYAQAASVQEGEHFLRGRLWQGLPPVPVWLSWYGDPYRELVRDAVWAGRDTRDAAHLFKRLARGHHRRSPADVQVDERQTGILARLGLQPRPRPLLPRLPLPQELTYRERRAIETSHGSRRTNPAKPEDRAAVIPDLDADAGRG